MIEQAKRCLAWAHDPARTVVPGAEDMTKDQVRVRVRVRARVRVRIRVRVRARASARVRVRSNERPAWRRLVTRLSLVGHTPAVGVRVRAGIELFVSVDD